MINTKGIGKSNYALRRATTGINTVVNTGSTGHIAEELG